MEQSVVDSRQSVTVQEIGSAKLLAGFALHVTSPVIAVNRKLSCDKENAQDAHSKEMRGTVA